MQVKKKPRNAAAKKIQKASPKEKCTKKEQTEQPLLKRMIFGEERPDLTELEAGSTTILDILAPTTVDTKSKDYIVVDGVYHTYLYITGYDAVNESSSLQIKYEVDKILRSFISLSKYDLISCAKEWRANNKSFQSALDYIYLSKDIIIKQDVLIS